MYVLGINTIKKAIQAIFDKNSFKEKFPFQKYISAYIILV